MLQGIKVWGLRKFYRFVSAHGWRRHSFDADWNGLEIPTADGPLHARMYRHGQGDPDKPLIVYFHGGGWVLGDLDTHTPFCRLLAERSGCTVISIDYRLAPEHLFPAAADDCLAATRWIGEHLGDFGPSSHRLVIAGDSAGGNLATCTCLEIGSPVRELIDAQVVIYPVTDHYQAGFASYVEKATGQTLTANLMRWFWDTYLGAGGAGVAQSGRAFPLRSDQLGTLPPTFLVTAENDPLRDEGKAFADKLRETGVPLFYRHFAGAAHGFACSDGDNEHLQAMMADLLTWLDGYDPAG